MHLAKRAVLALAIATAALGATAVAATPAQAQPLDPRQRADRAYKEGLDLAKAGNHEAALAKFEAAYSLSPTGIAVYQIARMEQALGRNALALQHFRESMKDAGLTAEMRREAERATNELRSKVGMIALDLPEGATTTLDGNEVDPKATIEVVPGLHVVKVRLGGETKSVDVTAPAGAVTPVKVRFVEEPPKPPPPAPPPPVVPENRPEFWTTGRIAGASVAGAGLVALGLGVVFQVGASSSATDADNIRASLTPPIDSACTRSPVPASCGELSTTVDDQRSQEGLRTGFFVAGGLLVAGGAVLFLLSPPKGERTVGARLVPVATHTGGGLSVVGRF